MDKRTLVEAGVTTSLHTESVEQVSDTLLHFEAEAYPAYQDIDTSIEQAFEVIKSQRQVVWAATAELACRSVTQSAVEHLDAGKSLLRPIPNTYQGLAGDEYSAASPTLKKLLRTVYAWFKPAFDEVFQKAEDGEMPYAAVVEVGTDIQPVYKWLQHAWLGKSAQPVARAQNALRGRRRLTPILSSYQEAVVDSLTANISHTAALLLGRGVAHSATNPPGTRRDFATRQLEVMADVSSVTRSASRPILLESEAMLDLYSRWEQGGLSAAEFHTLASQLGHSTPDACLHHSLANGRWERPGHCAADVRFVEPNKFTAPPATLLKKLGFNSIPKDISLTHLLLAMTTDIADGTAFTNWPS